MQLIRGDRYGRPMGYIMDADVDFEIGSAANTLNDFAVTFSRRDWTGEIQYGDWLYVPGTEYGGIVGEISTSTQHDTITAAGYTWRGILCKRVIEPDAGSDYKIVSGKMKAILESLIKSVRLENLFEINDQEAEIIGSFQFDRYCTVHEGIVKMLRSIGRKIKITAYPPNEVGNPASVVISTEKIQDYSNENRMADGTGMYFSMVDNRRGVNHLICLGKGELKDRIVIHLYTDNSGNIVDKPYYTGNEEIAEVYDSRGSEAEELRSNGVKKLVEVRNRLEYSASLERLEAEVDIGDIVGGVDALTNITVKRPIGRKIWTVSAGKEKVEYKLEGDS